MERKVCPVCAKGFTKHEHLQRHYRQHTKEKPFRCQCGKSFGRSDVLRRHERSNCQGESANLAPEAADNTVTHDDSLNGVASASNGAFQSPAPLPALSQATSDIWHSSLFTGEASDLANISCDDFLLTSLDAFLTDAVNEWAQGGTSGVPSVRGKTPLSRGLTPGQRTPRRGEGQDAAENTSPQYTIDEQYSNAVSRQLRSEQHSLDSVLSTSYLSLCLELYFERFHPIFPVVHAPSFRPRAENALLLASMCSIGSMLIGSDEAAFRGQQLYSRLNKAILASWETHLSERKATSLPMLQAALLGQTFGMLSQRVADRFMTESFQGTMLTWARSMGAFSMPKIAHDPATLAGLDASADWLAWAHGEEMRRLALALYVHDTETAYLAQREPYLRHQGIAYPGRTTQDILFGASSAQSWQQMGLGTLSQSVDCASVKIGGWISQRSPGVDNALCRSVRASAFAAYAVLSNIGACIKDRRCSGVWTEVEVQEHGNALHGWCKAYQLHLQDSRGQDLLCLKILWHHYSSMLHTDPALVDYALFEGSQELSAETTVVWAESNETACALLHSHLLRKRVSELPLGVVPPIHLARIIFAAGTLFAVHGRLGRREGGGNEEGNTAAKTAIMDMPNLTLVAEDQKTEAGELATWACGLLTGKQSILAAYGCIDLLRKLSCWGVATEFANKLQTCVRAEGL